MRTTIRKQQVPADFSILNHSSLPINVDGFVERHGRFLFIEVKTGEESTTGGQAWALRTLAGYPQFTILLVHSKFHETDANGTRQFDPESYSLITETQIRNRIATSTEDFRTRYTQWFEGNTNAFDYPEQKARGDYE